MGSRVQVPPRSPSKSNTYSSELVWTKISGQRPGQQSEISVLGSVLAVPAAGCDKNRSADSAQTSNHGRDWEWPCPFWPIELPFTWRCNTADAGSIPVVASNKIKHLSREGGRAGNSESVFYGAGESAKSIWNAICVARQHLEPLKKYLLIASKRPTQVPAGSSPAPRSP